ncbi:hypothetical protein ACOMHN_002921 [Nucella lapillus]
MSVQFRHILRSLTTSFPKQTVRRSLVPNRISGPKSIAVYYRVEEAREVSRISHLKRQLQQAHYIILTRYLLRKTMASPTEDNENAIFAPPASVRGMKTLDKSRFTRTISLPALRVPSKHISALSKSLKVALLKMQRVKPVAELAKDDPLHASHKLFLMDPRKFKTVEDFSAEEREKLGGFGVSLGEEFSYFDLEVGYENWGVAEILRAVLPETMDGVSGYSIIGHIAHLNLKPEVLDYKRLIGEVIIDKNSSVKTVVNKVNTIDNTYRNFQMELLAGEDNLVTRAKENGCMFEMDFSKVYWNPRLSTEHERVVKLLKAGDILYDVFAGVGPFAIPAAKRGVTVLANDLNPHSYSALTSNITLNKVKADRLQSYNLDGREFIVKVLKPDLVTRLRTTAEAGRSVSEHSDSEIEKLKPKKTDFDIHSGVIVSHSSLPAAKMERVVEVRAESKAGGDDNSQTDSAKSGKTEQKEASQHHSVAPTSHASDSPKLYIVMNLPALAPEFLDAFCGLLSDFPQELRSEPSVVEGLPTVMCYCFEHTNDDGESDVKARAEKIMGCGLPAGARVRSVRNVAPGKEMMCLEFRLTSEVLFGARSGGSLACPSNGQEEDEHPPRKKQKLSETA